MFIPQCVASCGGVFCFLQRWRQRWQRYDAVNEDNNDDNGEEMQICDILCTSRFVLMDVSYPLSTSSYPTLLDDSFIINYSRTLIIRTSIIRISRLSGLFLWSQLAHEYLLVTIKICSHILFKTTALKGAVKCEGFLLSTSKSSARACRN